MRDKKLVPGNKILVVDDQIGIVSFLYEFFRRKEFEVLQATSGRGAIKIVKKDAPSIVLLDVKLGWGKNGIQVLEEIKNIAPETNVIMMTSVEDKSVIEEAFSLGADDYIVKPFSLDYLEKVVMLKVLNLALKQLGRLR